MTPTPEQQSIIEAAVGTTDNLIISALAGAAKTTTLQLVCGALPAQPILSLAFNKRIAEEMSKKLPGHVACATMNAIGHRAWAATSGRRLTLDTDKIKKILRAQIDALPRVERGEMFDKYADLMATIRAARIQGYIPESIGQQGLINADTFYRGLDEDINGARPMIDRILTESIRQSMAGTIDFDDQIYMSALFSSKFPAFGIVMVDEAQDLSPLNHVMLDKLARQRLIAVGDPNQSIYAFRGAMTSSMPHLKERFNMTEMGLSVSFRCPKAVIREARRYTPQMQWPEWAIEGEVRDYEQEPSFEEGSAIVCRNNAPLLKLAFKLIREGKAVALPGFDIGPGLVRILRKFGPEGMTQKEVFDNIDRWAMGRIAAGKSEESTYDRAACLRIFAEQGSTLSAATAYAEALFKAKGTIQLMSGHKAKGLEWDNVYHLDPWRVPSRWAKTDEDLQQEHNIAYVITTRAKQKLGRFTMIEEAGE